MRLRRRILSLPPDYTIYKPGTKRGFFWRARQIKNPGGSFAEGWPSGRRRRFAKPLYGLKAVSRVQIPAPPPDYVI
jgi:hypothetical protein